MKLQDLENFDHITIQCHDNPDADALASGYGLYCYFKERGKQVRLLYSGRNEIQKSNLRLMIENLEIPVEQLRLEEVESFREEGILITVDCQYGAGNVTKLQAANVAIIDHHQREIWDVELSHILPAMGSCSTIVWKLLCEAGYKVNDENHLATALYYGLMSDTNNFTEIRNPVDRDMQDSLRYNQALITLFLNSNISLEELEVAGIAMLRCNYNEECKFAVIKSQPCDPNILGLISDFLLQVDRIHTCVVYNEVPGGFKLSVRSCTREVNASELAAFLTKGIGSGGGHYQKAGGFISKKLFEEQHGSMHSEAFFNSCMLTYFKQYELIYASSYEADTESMKLYEKKKLPLGYVKATDILPIGTPITVRNMEGDMELEITDELYIMIGIKGEVYVTNQKKFNTSYEITGQKFDYETCVLKSEYEPVVKNRLTGDKVALADYAGVCIPTGDVRIYARPLERVAKVFTNWDLAGYMVGKVGDYLAVRTDDLHDVYIIDQDVFGITYSEMK